MNSVTTFSIMIYACPAYHWSLFGIIFLYESRAEKGWGILGFTAVSCGSK